MSDPPSAASAWPAARPAGIDPIQHPAWEAARNLILDLAAQGPVTAVIVGEPGTGKTWLLRELASALAEHGFPAMMLMQGDLPMTLSSGAALLVDDASLMTESARAEMSAQRHGVVVLAGAEWFEDDLDPAAPTPVIIRLRPLRPSEVADFAAEWLRRNGRPPISDPAALSRLVDRSGGRVGTLVSLLGNPALWDFPPEPPPRSVPEPPPARRAALYRPLLVAASVAALIALGWALMPVPPAPPLLATAPNPVPPIVAQSAPPALPPLRHADIPGPALAAAGMPAQQPISLPPLAAPPAPDSGAVSVPAETEIPSSSPAIAAPPPVLTPPEPAVVATLEAPPSIQRPAPAKPSSPPSSPGLVLIAQRGDTLQSLYGNVYRDRRAPPFAKVLAANPGPLRPGAIVVFPAPPGGWQRVQR